MIEGCVCSLYIYLMEICENNIKILNKQKNIEQFLRLYGDWLQNDQSPKLTI